MPDLVHDRPVTMPLKIETTKVDYRAWDWENRRNNCNKQLKQGVTVDYTKLVTKIVQNTPKNIQDRI